MSSPTLPDPLHWPDHSGDFRFDGGVAVITGAGSGIGLAIARACAARHMKLVIADVNPAAIEAARAGLATLTDCTGMVVDVRTRAALDGLAEATFQKHGAVDLLFNNAGVVVARSLLETSEADWRWMLDVNLWSVIHGIGAFVPRMAAQGREGRIINTASAAGFLSEPDLGAYAVSKHGVVALSETLQKELCLRRANLGVTVLNPAFVPTAIVDSEKARPADLASDGPPLSEAAQAAKARLDKATRSGKMTAADVAAMALSAVARRRLHVFTHAKIRLGIEQRMAGVYEGFGD